ncbi:hypothetical protein S40285_06926 [Stachybotrys chlorohalonatus IBT 40285]|uniref:Uncharacterized protein n=1 Tax=Stachybotrys chlorohalonatus (strain IBT 40285) TaxID=1283841 RepID=A0A084QH28_STAC4|nr:hypothetical protein S40285_06926 [Stachybotrys chlorohalonata IBT 40285]
MVKPLSFKGDKKPKKRKRTEADKEDGESSKAMVKEDQDVDNDDTWVSADAPTDVSGPVMIVLPTDKPTALASDAAGKIFTMPIVNIVDDNPASAEPNDVRQVWVANRVSGTEHFRFKGAHGKFLSCDKIGALAATSGAITPLECFNVIATPDTPGTFQLQSTHDTFVTVQEPKSTKSNAVAEVRGDADAISFNTTLRIRMQARYKPRHRASKEERAQAKISRKELEETVGRRLEEDEVRILKKARREGNYHETLLDFKSKTKHDKFS